MQEIKSALARFHRLPVDAIRCLSLDTPAKLKYDGKLKRVYICLSPAWEVMSASVRSRWKNGSRADAWAIGEMSGSPEDEAHQQTG